MKSVLRRALILLAVVATLIGAKFVHSSYSRLNVSIEIQKLDRLDATDRIEKCKKGLKESCQVGDLFADIGGESDIEVMHAREDLRFWLWFTFLCIPTTALAWTSVHWVFYGSFGIRNG